MKTNPQYGAEVEYELLPFYHGNTVSCDSLMVIGAIQDSMSCSSDQYVVKMPLHRQYQKPNFGCPELVCEMNLVLKIRSNLV